MGRASNESSRTAVLLGAGACVVLAGICALIFLILGGPSARSRHAEPERAVEEAFEPRRADRPVPQPFPVDRPYPRATGIQSAPPPVNDSRSGPTVLAVPDNMAPRGGMPAGPTGASRPRYHGPTSGPNGTGYALPFTAPSH